MRVLVTGGAEYICSVVEAWIREGDRVVDLARARVVARGLLGERSDALTYGSADGSIRRPRV